MSIGGETNLRVPQAGEVIGDKYEIGEAIGAGAMGVVVAAQHRLLRQRVAIKFISMTGADPEHDFARFTREARAAALLDSEHIVRVLDFGALDSGTPFLVMQYLEGRDLAQEVKAKGGKLRPVEAVDYAIQACAGLAEAHSHGIVHRDIKPANLFVTRRPTGEPVLKILDFGISKFLWRSASETSLVDTVSLVGSPSYMSPEQIRQARDLDHRTDIWSLGVVLHELCIGSRPFAAETSTAMFAAIAADEPPPMRTLDAEIPSELEAIVRRCLRKAPGFRFPNAAALALALAPLASERGKVIARRVDLDNRTRILSRDEATAVSGAGTVPSTMSMVPSVRDAASVRWPRSGRRGLAAAIGVGVLVTIGVAARYVHGPARAAGTNEASVSIPSVSSTLPAPTLPAATPAPTAPSPTATTDLTVTRTGVASGPPAPGTAPAASGSGTRAAGARPKGRHAAASATSARAPVGSSESTAGKPRDPLDDHN